MEQLRNCSGAVTKVFRSRYDSVPEQLASLPEHISVFRSSYKSSETLLSFLEQLVSIPEQRVSAMELFPNCSGAVMKVFRSS